VDLVDLGSSCYMNSVLQAWWWGLHWVAWAKGVSGARSHCWPGGRKGKGGGHCWPGGRKRGGGWALLAKWAQREGGWAFAG
jgi:hypothetical protein